MYFEYGRWCAQHRITGDLPILLRCDRGAPDAEMRVAALAAVHNITLLEQLGRAYLAALPDPRPRLNLWSLEVFRLVSEWHREELIPEGLPLVSVQFEISGDANVVDVIFRNNKPIEFDYD
jgi:hypothetical protein